MALNKDSLGQARYNNLLAFNNKTVEQINDEYGDVEAFRLAYFKADSEAIIEHFKNEGVLLVPGTGLFAGSTPVTGNSTTGSLT